MINRIGFLSLLWLPLGLKEVFLLQRLHSFNFPVVKDGIIFEIGEEKGMLYSLLVKKV